MKASLQRGRYKFIIIKVLFLESDWDTHFIKYFSKLNSIMCRLPPLLSPSSWNWKNLGSRENLMCVWIFLFE